MRASDRRLRQRVIDSEQRRCCFVQVPFLMLNDVVVGRLQPTAVILWLYYKRRAWEEHSAGPPIESLREIEDRSGLSRGTILAARKSLADTGWIELQVQGFHRSQVVTVMLLDRWQENTDEICSRHGPTAATVQNLDNPPGFGRNPDMYVQKPAMHVQNLDKAELDLGLKTPEELKDLTPPTPEGAWGDGDKQDGTTIVLKAVDSFQPALPRTAAVGLPEPACRDPGEELLAAFYRGLGTDIGGLTQTVRRRELKTARALVAIRATPAEAEAYARETSAVPNRIAAVDLRSFERERSSWLARRRDRQPVMPLRIANGRMPE